MEEIWESDYSIRREVERRLDERREEEESMMMMLAKVEEKRKRLERVEMLRKILMKKMAAQKLRTVLQMLHSLTLEELEMEVDEVEALVMELMDTEELQELDTVEMSEVTITDLEGEVGISEYMEDQSSTRDSLENKEEEDNLEMNEMEVEEATDILDKWVGAVGTELITGGYTPGWEFSLPKYTFISYKPHCSRRRLEKFGPESVDEGSEDTVESISNSEISVSEIGESQLLEMKATADISNIAEIGELGVPAIFGRAVCDVKGKGTTLRSAVQGSLQENNDEHLTFGQNRGGDIADLHLISTSNNAREASKTKDKIIFKYTTISSVKSVETSKRPRDLDDGESLIERTRHKKKWRGN